MALINRKPFGQPQPKELDPNATVAGQMQNIMASGNPLLQRAKTNAAKVANKRGLLNSSMAVQAGEEAALSAALPIAQQDASTYAQRGAMDRQFQQQVGGGQYGSGLIGANLQAQQALQKGQQGFASSESALGRQQQKDILGTQQGFAGSQAALGRQQQKDILGTQQGFAGSQSALDRAQQLGVLGQQQEFAGTQAGLGRTQQKDILGTQQDFAGTQAGLGRTQQKDILGTQQEFAGSQAALGRTQQKDILGTQQEFAGTQAGYDRAQQLSVLGQQHANAMEAAQTTQDFQQANMQMQTDLQERLAVLGYEQNIGLSNLQNQFDLGKIDAQVFANTQGQYLQAVNELIRQTQISVGELQAAPDISGEDKSKMFADQGLLLQTHLGLYKNLYENAATWSQDWVDFPDAA